MKQALIEDILALSKGAVAVAACGPVIAGFAG